MFCYEAVAENSRICTLLELFKWIQMDKFDFQFPFTKNIG